MEVNEESRIKEYLDKVCSRVRCKRSHKQIEEELSSHIEEKKRDYVSCGISEEEAVERSLRDMGSSEVLGEELNKVHKEKVDWVILSIVMILIIVGFVGMYSLREIADYRFADENFYMRKMMIFTILGMVILAVAVFKDYRKIEKYSKKIYIASLIATALLIFVEPINGRTMWLTIGPISINVRDLTTIGSLIGLVGIYNKINWRSKIDFIVGITLGLIPLIELAIITKSLATVLVYIISLAILICKTSKNKKVIVFFILLIGIFLFILGSSMGGDDYLLIKIKEMANLSVFIGRGNGVDLMKVPNTSSDLMFISIIYNFGWLFGIGVISIVLLFIIKLFLMMKKVSGEYGKNLLLVISTMLGVQYFLSIGYNLGITEVGGVSVPFISYGGSGIAMSLFIIGIIINILKGKDLKEG